MGSLWGRWRAGNREEIITHWVAVSGSTPDGVRVRMAVDFTARHPPGPGQGAEGLVVAAEEALRRLVTSTPAVELPVPGDAPDWRLPGVEHAVVTTCDLEMSATLRRLLGDRRELAAWS